MTDNKETPTVVEDVKTALDLEALESKVTRQIAETEDKLRSLGKSAVDKILFESYKAHLEALLLQRLSFTGIANSSHTVSNNSEPSGAAHINADLKEVKLFSGKNFELTEPFLDHINQIYEAEIKDAPNRAALETYFLRRVKASKISREVFDKMKIEGEDVETLSDFSGFIRKYYLPKENPFQIFSKVFDEEWNPPRDKIHSVAQKIDQKAKVACATFKAMWEKERPGASMTVEDAFLFAGGTHLFNLIREREPQTSRDLVNKLEKVFSATELAAKAEVYRDQNGNTSNVLYSEPNPNRKQNRKPHWKKNEQKKNVEKKKSPVASPKGNSKVLTVKTNLPTPVWRLPESKNDGSFDRSSYDSDQDFH